MTRDEFRKRLSLGPLLLDGAMGTMLHSRGIAIDECFDAANLRNPALVAEIHRRYVDAGADVIETNTFGANRYKLRRHGLESQLVEINQAAVSVARRVIAGSFKPVLLAGSIGPLGVRLAPLGRVRAAEAEAAFAEQIEALTSPVLGLIVDLLILETIPALQELEVAVRATRSVAADLPLIGLATFTRDDRTVLGERPADVAARLAELDLDVIGVNCSGGPVQVLRLLSIFHESAPEMHLAAIPNAGWPQQLDSGRVFYPASPDYFATYARAFISAGAAVVGGCCGTNEEHIAAMRRSLDTPYSEDQPAPAPYIPAINLGVSAPADQPTHLKQALDHGRFIVTVELSPPRGVAAQRMLSGARMLKEAGANFFDVADSPLARMRMSAWAAAHLLQKELGIEAVLHFPTRGRNLLRIQGDLLAAHALGIRNLFVIMGDPTQIGDYPEAMDDYDIVPSGLIRLIKKGLNSGVDQAGQSIDQPTSFTVGCALNLEPHDPHREINLLKKKIEGGADFALTQPIFDPARAVSFIAECHRALNRRIPIIAGIQPLYNSRNAEFLHNEVPGITVPESLQWRMRAADNQQSEGIKIARETVEALRHLVQGVYLIPVFGRYDLVAEVLDAIGGI